MASTNGFEPDARSATDDFDDDEGRGWSVGRVLAVVAFLAVAIFWVWALSPLASRSNPDSLDDDSIRLALEPICAATREAIVDVPNAREARNLDDRADQIATVSVELRLMVDELAREIPADDPAVDNDDGELLEGWIDDWRTYLGDRDRHEALLRDGQDVRFAVTAVEGNQITDRIDQFATFINGMPSCATPLDL